MRFFSVYTMISSEYRIIIKRSKKEMKNRDREEALVMTAGETKERTVAEAGEEIRTSPIILNPESVIYEVDVHMNTAVLYDYMLRHVYTSLTGPIATVIGGMLLLFFLNGAGVLYLLAGIVVIAYLPWNLFLNAKRQTLTNEDFKKPLHYSFTGDGVYVSQGESLEMQKWEQMYKAVSTGKSVILYTSKASAAIFPRKDLGNDATTLLEILCTHMDSKKIKFKQ